MKGIISYIRFWSILSDFEAFFGQCRSFGTLAVSRHFDMFTGWNENRVVCYSHLKTPRSSISPPSSCSISCCPVRPFPPPGGVAPPPGDRRLWSWGSLEPQISLKSRLLPAPKSSHTGTRIAWWCNDQMNTHCYLGMNATFQKYFLWPGAFSWFSFSSDMSVEAANFQRCRELQTIRN